MSRISPGTVLVGFIAIAAGLVGAYLVRERSKPQPTVVAETAPVVVESQIVPLAALELKSGRKISLGDIQISQLTPTQMDEQGIKTAYMADTRQIIGRVLRKDIEMGATFSPTDFYPEGTGPSIADLLDPGMRAITVPVNLDAAVAGFATPGTWVDVVFKSQPFQTEESDNYPAVAVTLLERVRVLAVEEETGEGIRVQDRRQATAKTAVTLQVSPEGAAALSLVEGKGTLALSLRHPDDDSQPVGMDPISLEELLSVPKQEKHEIEVFRGKRMTRVGFAYSDNGQSSLTRLVDTREDWNKPLVADTPEQLDKVAQKD